MHCTRWCSCSAAREYSGTPWGRTKVTSFSRYHRSLSPGRGADRGPRVSVASKCRGSSSRAKPFSQLVTYAMEPRRNPPACPQDAPAGMHQKGRDHTYGPRSG